MILPISEHESVHLDKYPKIYICKNIYTSIFCDMVVICWTNTFTKVSITMSLSCSCSSRVTNVCNIFFFLACIFFPIWSMEFHLLFGMHRSCFPCSIVIISIHKYSHFLLVFFSPYKGGVWQAAGSVFGCQPRSIHQP